MLSSSNYEGYNLRIYFKRTISYIEDDMKIDNMKLKKRLIALIERDPAMLEEDLLEDFTKGEAEDKVKEELRAKYTARMKMY